MSNAAGLAYREAGPAGAPPVLLLHGYPESSYMWRGLLPAVADAGWRALAPDLAGYGDSPPSPPGTWERHMESVERFREELALDPVVLVVHDWGGLIGLRWACEHPEAVRALVISCTGFFPEGKWHGLAQAMRTPGQGEELVRAMDRDGFTAFMRQASPWLSEEALDEYWKGFADDVRRQGHLELYRSGDFDKLEAYRGRLASLEVPALVLWGEHDPYAPVAGAHRFHKELPGSQLAIIDAGHFVFEDAPEACAQELVRFLQTLSG
jgi:haloalkane dehalogenase